MGETTSTAVEEAVTVREVTPEDAKECARICFEAFGGIDDHHRFPRSFPALEFAEGLMQAFIGSPFTWGVVAERNGRIVGSNFLLEADPIAGVGPISVDPDPSPSIACCNSGLRGAMTNLLPPHPTGIAGGMPLVLPPVSG